MTVLAIDQGTTSTKAYLLDPEGGFRSVGSVRHRQILPGPGRVEHDAAELLAAIDGLIDAALQMATDIRAIALANQGETVVAWDRLTGQPLYHAIVWQDQRTQGWIDALTPDQRALVLDRAGLPCDAYFSAAKLAWLLREVPQVARAARQGRLGLGTSDAFFLDWLTGTCATDVTTASRTSLMHLSRCTWDPELCALFGVPIDLLPPIRPSAAPFGHVSRQGREVPVLVSLVDQQAALFGHGCRDPGDAKITFGTGSFALAVAGAAPPVPRDGLVPTVAWQFAGQPPVYALEAGDYTAAAAVDWCRSIGLAGSLQDFACGDVTPAILRHIAFVPALAGLAAPWWRRDAQAAFFGLTQSSTLADMRQAVIEGVVLRGADLIDLICSAGRKPISVDGGLAQNDHLVQMLANALGRPVHRHHSADLTARGAGMMAWAVLGHDWVEAGTKARDVIEPDTQAAQVQAARGYFRAAVQAVMTLAAHRPDGRGQA